MVAKVDNLALTVIAAFAFFAATVGINMVANFLPVLTAEDVKVASKKWKPILKDWGIDY